jgi:pyruvate formate lyase activating enzyme
MMSTATLEAILNQRTREGELYEKLPDKKVRCTACGHRCVILSGLPGICKVRYNRDGTLFVPSEYVGALQCDPIEKKPFFHAMPGSLAMSFGMLGCDYHCAYCQNWFTSQALRDPRCISSPEDLSARDLVDLSLKHRAKVVASTYNEPLITSEWAVQIFRRARQADLKTAYISNGNGTPEVLEYLRPWLDMYKVDLKSFRDKNYRKLGGRIGPVLDTIQLLHRMGIWLEVVTLIVPGFNDSDEELSETARFLAAISPSIPWHVTAFHKDYKMTDPDNTSGDKLLRACEIGSEAGLHFVYAGNLPGRTGRWENTYCPACRSLLIERRGFHVMRNLLQNGCCPQCQGAIPGLWN